MKGNTPPEAKTRSVPLQLLSQPNFRRLWISGALVGTMRWLDVLVVGVYVLEISGSAFQVALAMFIRTVPMLLLGTIAGAYAEAVDRRRLLIGIFTGMGLIYLILYALALNDQLNFWLLMVGVFYVGFIRTVDFPIRRAMISETTEARWISPAMALDTSTNNFTRMLGPFLGGFIFAFLGIDGALLLGGILHLAGAYFLMNVAAGRKPETSTPGSTLRNIIDGFRYIRSNDMVKALLAMTVVLNFFGFSHLSLAPVIAAEDLGLSAAPIGMLLSLEGGGAFLAAIVISFMTSDRWTSWFFVGGSFLYLIGVGIFAMSGTVVLASIGMLAAGFGMAGFGVLQWSLIISHTPPEMRTRVMGTLTMCIGVTPIGILCTGYLATAFGSAIAVTIMAGLGLFGVLATCLIWPVILRARAVSD